jgi:hypothetical protein
MMGLGHGKSMLQAHVFSRAAAYFSSFVTCSESFVGFVFLFFASIRFFYPLHPLTSLLRRYENRPGG